MGMNAAEFLQAAHGAMAKLVAEGGPDALAGCTFAFLPDGRRVLFEILNPEAGPNIVAALAHIVEHDPAAGLLAFDYQAAPAECRCPFDGLFAGTYYERDAEPLVRPFCMEYTASPFRLGWYEFAPAPGLDADEHARTETMIALQNEVTRKAIATLRAGRKSRGG